MNFFPSPGPDQSVHEFGLRADGARRTGADRPTTRYRAFGLTIESEIALPDLAAAAADASAADVTIRFGEVGDALPGGRAVNRETIGAPGALLLNYPPARYLIEAGRTITLAPRPVTSARDIPAYLLGSAMGAILHQRGMLPLHANAVEIDGAAVAFAGPSGAGKSTLAAALHGLGYSILSDDVCAISLGAGRPLTWPGAPRIKLWRDALTALGRDAADLQPVFEGEEKFVMRTSDPPERPLPLAAVCILEAANDDAKGGLRALAGAEAFAAVYSNLYRREYGPALGLSQAQFADVLALVESVPVLATTRTANFDRLKVEAEPLLRQVRDVGRSTA